MWTLLCLACLPVATAALDEQEGDTTAPVLGAVEVRASRLRGVEDFQLPASVSTRFTTRERNGDDVAVSALLQGVPGLLARERLNYAQDTQLSIRGFGARSTFGVRGLRLYADGIPATLPDGQGQLSHFSLAGSSRIEVMRGPFSALYGNAAGGVLQIHSAVGAGPLSSQLRASSAGDSGRTLGARLEGGIGSAGGFGLTAQRFDVDGYRQHSAARREQGNLVMRVTDAGARQWQLVANHLDAPFSQDPLGLTRAQLLADPRQAPMAQQFNTRKSVRQAQTGLGVEQPLGNAHSVRIMAYAGSRDVQQFLAVPVAAQSNPLHSGGVVDLAGDYHGADLRWSFSGELAGRKAEWTLGSSLQRFDQHRRGFENFIGSNLGVLGALRRDERNLARSEDHYAQLWLQLDPRWSVLAGARHSQVRLRARDAYITGSNPDDSGQASYRQASPVVGLGFAVHEDLRLHLAFGRGFETPTFNELSYRLDGAAGLALDLRPASSRNVELGLKWRSPGGAQLQAALFDARTDDELAVARNSGGRSSFRNVGRARRAGAELELALPLSPSWQLELGLTRLHARFDDPFTTASGSVVAAGARIPGLPHSMADASLRWQGPVWSAAVQLQALSATPVDDLDSQHAPGHALLNLEFSRPLWSAADGGLRAFLRVDNLLDRHSIASVIVNEANGRFFEPGVGRTVRLGLDWAVR